MKDLSKGSVKNIIEHMMKKHGVSNLYTMGSNGLSFDINDGFEFYVDGDPKEFRKELGDALSDGDQDVWTSIGVIMPENKEKLLKMFMPVYIDNVYVGGCYANSRESN